MKVLLSILGLAVIGGGVWLLFFMPSSYEVTINDEITELQDELVAIEAAVAAGTLTPEQAEEARVRIADRVNKITSSLNGATEGKLTQAQKEQLQAGLTSLQQILITYRDTLVTVDAEAAKSTNRRGGGSYRTLASQISDAIDTVEETVEEVDEDYVEDSTIVEIINDIEEEIPETVDELIEEIEETTSTDSEMTEESEDNTTEEMGDDEVTTDESDASGTVEVGADVEVGAADEPLQQ